MAKTTFVGPVRTGKDTGVSAVNTIGILEAVQFATVAATTQFAFLPSLSDITQIFAIVPIGSSAGAAGSVINFSNAAGAAANIGSITTSGAGYYELQSPTNAVSAATFVGASGALYASTPTATVASVFIAGVRYIQRP